LFWFLNDGFDGLVVLCCDDTDWIGGPLGDGAGEDNEEDEKMRGNETRVKRMSRRKGMKRLRDETGM
jgi:hypothetical protein